MRSSASRTWIIRVQHVRNLETHVSTMTTMLNGILQTVTDMKRVLTGEIRKTDAATYTLQSLGGGGRDKTSFIDAKKMMPDMIGKDSNWRNKSGGVTDYIGLTSPEMHAAMDRVQHHKLEIGLGGFQHVHHRLDDHDLRNFLTDRCSRGTVAGDIIESSCGKPGLDSWRLCIAHFDPLQDRRAVELTMQVMHPGRASSLEKLFDMTPKWENDFAEIRRRFGHDLPDEIKVFILLGMAPRGLDEELSKDMHTIQSYIDLKVQIVVIIYTSSRGTAPMVHRFGREDMEEQGTQEEEIG